jgi:hypothetical protein
MRNEFLTPAQRRLQDQINLNRTMSIFGVKGPKKELPKAEQIPQSDKDVFRVIPIPTSVDAGYKTFGPNSAKKKKPKLI